MYVHQENNNNNFIVRVSVGRELHTIPLSRWCPICQLLDWNVCPNQRILFFLVLFYLTTPCPFLVSSLIFLIIIYYLLSSLLEGIFISSTPLCKCQSLPKSFFFFFLFLLMLGTTSN